MTDGISETARIERDLAQTRARMDSRLDELQDHLTPKQMLNDAFAYFRGNDGGAFTGDLIARAKANPLPVALTGIGIVWLMASNSDSKKVDKPLKVRDDLEARFRTAEGNVQRFDSDDEDSYKGRLDDARGKVVGVARTASDTAASYAQRIRDAVASAGQSLRETSHDISASTGDVIGHLGTSAGHHGAAIQKGSKDMAQTARDTIASLTGNPLALGAVAALVGLVAGSLIPTSDKEEESLGSVAVKLRTAGLDLAQDIVDRGGRIASDTFDAVKGSAEAHGLSTDKPVGELLGDAMHGDLIGDLKQVAKETLGAARKSAEARIKE